MECNWDSDCAATIWEAFGNLLSPGDDSRMCDCDNQCSLLGGLDYACNDNGDCIDPGECDYTRDGEEGLRMG